MKRRGLVRLGCAALAAMPAGARAQTRPARVGLLLANEPPPGVFDAFRDGLRRRGYVEGNSLVLEIRVPRSTFEKEPDLAAELARSGVDVIVAWPVPAVIEARRVTSTIPIVMVSVGDPIGTGLVSSLARPEGNITGFSNLAREIGAKQAELLVEIVPGIRRVGLVFNSRNPGQLPLVKETEAACRQLQLVLQTESAESAREFEDIFGRLSQSGVQGVMFVPDPSILEHRVVIAEQGKLHRLPTMFQRRENVLAGGLMSYGANLADQFRQATSYVERLLKGARPADLPVVQPERFELVVNRVTADTLGLAVPAALLARADEVIE